MKIPDKFKIAGNEITVVIEDKLPDNQYGYWSDVTNTIHLAKTIDEKYAGVVTLTQAQMLNTFWHEVMHAFQFYFDNGYNEGQAQVYANFMCEFIDSTDKPF